MSVNLSPAQFKDPNLLNVVICALVESDLPPERLELEITETTLMENEATPWEVLRRLKAIGISVALDDFGTGYSSLSYLTKFPFDKIKIDKSFTQNMTKRASHAAIISSTLAMASTLSMTTTAEGIETRQQYDILRAAGITYMQGYLFGKAVPKARLDFTKVLGRPEPKIEIADVA